MLKFHIEIGDILYSVFQQRKTQSQGLDTQNQNPHQN